jgi:hypothetical protein
MSFLKEFRPDFLEEEKDDDDDDDDENIRGEDGKLREEA